MHQRILYILGIVLISALLLSACGSQGTPQAAQSPGEATALSSPVPTTDIQAYPSPVVQLPGSVGAYPEPGAGETPAAASSGLDGLLVALQAAGFETLTGEAISQAFFSVPGMAILVNGEELQVFEYPAPETAEFEAGNVASDGSSVGTTMIDWVSTPHFFRAGNLIVLYVGENEALLQALNAVLGAQFAGG